MQKSTISLKEVKLTKDQSSWLSCAYKLGDQIEEIEILRQLGDEFPSTFRPFEDLKNFWSYSRLTIFGIYKINEKDDLVVGLDLILKILRNDFIRRPNKKTVSKGELSEILKMDIGLLKRIFDSGYFQEFWGGDNSYLRYDSNIKENVYDFSNLGEFQRIREYINFDEQIEIQWQRLHKPHVFNSNDFLETDGAVVTTEIKDEMKIENVSGEENGPMVFVSYSHDSKDHKRWVLTFAQRLISNGIQVIFDAWDLGYGDDVARFMQQSVTRATRVILICTDTYVRKANEGVGGAGYEAMIITGELVRDQGKAKFIPVVRQMVSDPILPDFLPTRRYANLSDDSEEEFKQLLRSLHDLPPQPKPPLGKNPFLTDDFIEVKEETVEENNLTTEDEIGISPLATYEKGLSLIRNKDYAGWREFIRKLKGDAIKSCLDRISNMNVPATYYNNFIFESELRSFEPLFSALLAGIASEDDKFKRQTGILVDLMHIPGWPRSGLTKMVRFPEALVFIFQILYGSLCILTEQIDGAVDLADTKLANMYRSPGDLKALYCQDELAIWPVCLRDGTIAPWDFMKNLAGRLTIINKIFGDGGEWSWTLATYFATMGILEFSDIAHDENRNLTDGRQIGSYCLPYVLNAGSDTVRQTVSFLSRNKSKLIQILEDRGVNKHFVKKYWPVWVDGVYQIANDTRDGFFRNYEQVGLEKIFD